MKDKAYNQLMSLLCIAIGTAFVTCCFGLGCIWALIDFIIILCGNFTDKAGLRITNWDAKY